MQLLTTWWVGRVVNVGDVSGLVGVKVVGEKRLALCN